MTNSRIACGLWKGCQAGGGLHDPRCPASGQTTPASACAHRWEPDATGVGVICMNCGSDEPAPASAAANGDRDKGVPGQTKTDRDTPASAEPTLTERQRAVEAVERATRAATIHAGALADHLAQTLAVQRAEIVARYEAVAAQIIDDIGNSSSALVSGPLYARRIREAAPK